MLSVDPTRHRRVAQRRFRVLIAAISGPSWPATWAGLVLLGVLIGCRFPTATDPVFAVGTARVLCLAPFLLLGCRSPRWLLSSWLAMAAAAVGVGGLLAGSPASLPAAIAEAPWSPTRHAEVPAELVVRVRTDARSSASGSWSVAADILQCHAAQGAAALLPGPGIMLRGREQPPMRGAVIAVRSRLRPPRRASIAGGFDESFWLRGRDLHAVALVDDWIPTPASPGDAVARGGPMLSALRSRLADVLADGLPPGEASVAAAVLLGYGLAGDLRDPFASLGLAHLFALSGLHVGIIAGLGLLLLRPVPLPAPTRDLLLIPLLLAYALLVDLPGSVVRAVGLVSAVLLARAVGRRADALRILGMLLWANVLWRPWMLIDVGSQLSYLAAGSIVAGQRVMAPRLHAARRPVRALLGALTVTTSAQIGTLPVVASVFGVLPLAGPLYNLVVVPAFGVVASLLASGLLLSMVWGWAGEGLLGCAAVALRLLTVGAAVAAGEGGGLVRGLPVWSAGQVIGHAVLALVLVFVVRRRGWQAAPLSAAAYACMLGWAAWSDERAAPVTVWQLPVGQGDCALVEFGDGWRLLIDTGDRWYSGGSPLARDLLPWLRRRGIGHLHAVLLTHGHGDHTGGASDLAAHVQVDRWLLGGSAEAPPGSAPGHPAHGDTLHRFADWSLVVYHPGAEDGDLHGENDRSVALGLVRDGWLRGLWTGDLEHAGEARLLGRCPPPPSMGLDVWKAGHHGSNTSGTPELLDTLRPRLIVISTGVANRHRHPSHGPFLAAGDTVPLLRTDLHGAVRLSWRNDILEATATRLP